MAAGQITLYASNCDDLNINDLVGAICKVALVTSAYTPDATVTGHSAWASVSANEIVAGNGYIAGGATIATDAATAITGGFKWTSANVSWTASGGNIPAWRYAVLYVSGSLWGITNPLIGYFLGDATPADVPATASGQTLSITLPTDGWFKSIKSP